VRLAPPPVPQDIKINPRWIAKCFCHRMALKNGLGEEPDIRPETRSCGPCSPTFVLVTLYADNMSSYFLVLSF
jgi:hypothetical protein